jgi:hypothetical protein
LLVNRATYELLHWNDANGLAIQRAFDGEFHLAVNHREKRMVFTLADVDAGVYASTALANDDGTCMDP